MNPLEAHIAEEVARRGLRLEIIRPTTADRQTAWMDQLIADFHAVTVDAFGRWLPYQALEDRSREADYLLVLREETGRMAGFMVNNLLALDGTMVNYFSTDMIRREYHGLGLYPLLNSLRAEALPATALMTRTQNPRVYRAFRQVCVRHGYNIYPSSDRTTPEALRLAKAFSPEVREDLIVESIYDFGEGRGARALMYDTPPPKSDEELIWRHLNIEQGDAVLILGVKHG